MTLNINTIPKMGLLTCLYISQSLPLGNIRSFLSSSANRDWLLAIRIFGMSLGMTLPMTAIFFGGLRIDWYLLR